MFESGVRRIRHIRRGWRAYDLFKIGLLFAASRFEGEEQAFLDVWEFGVRPHAIVRDEGEATSP